MFKNKREREREKKNSETRFDSFIYRLTRVSTGETQSLLLNHDNT